MLYYVRFRTLHDILPRTGGHEDVKGTFIVWHRYEDQVSPTFCVLRLDLG